MQCHRVRFEGKKRGTLSAEVTLLTVELLWEYWDATLAPGGSMLLSECTSMAPSMLDSGAWLSACTLVKLLGVSSFTKRSFSCCLFRRRRRTKNPIAAAARHNKRLISCLILVAQSAMPMLESNAQAC